MTESFQRTLRTKRTEKSHLQTGKQFVILKINVIISTPYLSATVKLLSQRCESPLGSAATFIYLSPGR